MKDILKDIVAYTHSLGFLSLVKVTNDENGTVIDSMAEDRSVILKAKTHEPVNEFVGVFGMPNLDKLNLHLKNPEYQKNESITVVTGVRNNEELPTHIHFENENGDFQNDYRFMNQEIINEKMKSVKFKGTSWQVVFEPSSSAIQRFKLQSAANSEETLFKVRTEDTDLIFLFGEQNTHAGQFVFQPNISGALKHTWSWPVSQVQSILNLAGKIEMKLSDQGVMMISIDSGLAHYEYILPALSK